MLFLYQEIPSPINLILIVLINSNTQFFTKITELFLKRQIDLTLYLKILHSILAFLNVNIIFSNFSSGITIYQSKVEIQHSHRRRNLFYLTF